MGRESTEEPISAGEPSPVSVYFQFENAPFPDNDLSFNTEPVEIYGPPADYVATIPPQPADQTFSSFLMFIEGVDQGVVAWDINVNMMSGPGIPMETVSSILRMPSLMIQQRASIPMAMVSQITGTPAQQTPKLRNRRLLWITMTTMTVLKTH